MAQVTTAEIDQIVEGHTVATDFVARASKHPDAVAITWREGDGWGQMTFGEWADRVAACAKGLAAAGIGHGDRVVMMMRNRPEFHVVDLAALMVGATPVSIYNSSAADQIQYLADHCQAKVAVLEDRGFAERMLAVRDGIPSLGDVFVIDGAGEIDGVRDYQELFQSGSVDLEQASTIAQPGDLATLIYTSGTTGPPKGVMISHYNLVWTVESLVRALPFDDTQGLRVVSYLPMAHIAERVTSHYGAALLGYEVATCPDPSLLSEYLKEVRPDFMFGVPRVYEKIYAGINAALAADPDKARQFNEAVDASKPICIRRLWGEASEEDEATWKFLDEVAFAPIRALLGLDNVQVAVTGAAPIPGEMLLWFNAIGVPLSEIYGMSESSGPMTYEARRIKPGTVGPAIPGCEVKLADDGEIICRGGNVFQGYLNAPDKTAEALDDDGWLHSGDIGEMDEDGYFRIVDRKKELIITAGGKNISPANLEAALKMIPLVGQACAIGDQRKFVSALVVLDPDVAPAWAKSNGIDTTDLSELAQHPKVRETIEAALPEVMAEFNSAEAVKKVTIIGEEWMPDSDVLTPTSKLKRRGIHARYEAEIEAMYQ